MIKLAVLLVLMVATTVAEAAPRRVLVLPLDGNAEPTLRNRLNLSLQKLVRSKSPNATVGDTTFSETAAAVGCDPGAPTCAETVRSTLTVDELVWGTATWSAGETNLVVYRAVAKQPTSSVSVLLGPQDPPDKADATLEPLLDGQASTAPVPDPIEPVPPEPVEPVPPKNNRKRNTGIIIASGGGLVLLIGIALWSNKSGVQDDIDSAPTDDPDDFARLEELESRAFKYAMAGNVMVLAGLGVGAYGGWLIYQDHKERRMVVTPQVTPTSATVMLRGTW